MQRSSGILLPVFSLPGKYGSGTLGNEAYKFVDFLYKSGQRFWQVLPAQPTTYGDSPYQSPSAFAGNPYFVDLDLLMADGLLTREDCEEASRGWEETKINYEALYKRRLPLLRKAFGRFKDEDKLKAFIRRNPRLKSYAFFQSIKDSFSEVPWTDWPMKLKKRDPETLRKYEKKLSEDIKFYIFVQLKFFDQWRELKKYANDRGIYIIGDIPIYIALDSADVWENQEIFKLNANGGARSISGTPPDYFSPTGQLWGNPIYDWKKMKEDGYSWWMDRIKASFKLYDTLRIDHFRGLESYYQIAGKDKTAEHGKWVKGPGKDFIDTIKSTVKNADIIAEDLGFLTKKVAKLLDYSGYPGMKVLEFAFDGGLDNAYLPHMYPENCVAYTGTHDNNTALGWILSADTNILKFAGKYLGIPGDYIKFLVDTKAKTHYLDEKDKGSCVVSCHTTEKEKEEATSTNGIYEYCVRSMIRALFMSKANRVIIPLQDWLTLDDSARMNMPSTLGDNWTWRMSQKALSDKLAAKIKEMTEMFAR